MQQLEGFKDRNDSCVTRLLKGLYGLKQGGHKWFWRLEEVLLELGFVRIRLDLSIFVWECNGIKVIVPVFVGDITFALCSKAQITTLKDSLLSTSNSGISV